VSYLEDEDEDPPFYSIVLVYLLRCGAMYEGKRRSGDVADIPAPALRTYGVIIVNMNLSTRVYPYGLYLRCD
jgi:hypothetical protein